MDDPVIFFIGVIFGVLFALLGVAAIDERKVQDCAEQHNVYTCEWVLEPKLKTNR